MADDIMPMEPGLGVLVAPSRFDTRAIATRGGASVDARVWAARGGSERVRDMLTDAAHVEREGSHVSMGNSMDGDSV